MLSHVLPVVALAGLVAASCPLTLKITDTVDHIAQVAVTNTGNETVTVFRGNTVFSDHPTKDLLIKDAAGEELPFEGMYVNYKKTGLTPAMFQTILPGETITSAVNAAQSYQLVGVDKCKVSAIQGFRYVTGSVAPTVIAGTLSCESVISDSVDLTPDQTKVAEEHITKRDSTSFSRINKRAVTYSSCSTAQTTSLMTSVTNAIAMSKAASTAAGTGAAFFTVWFKSTSVEATVQGIYNKVVGVQTTSPKISCTDVYSDCTDGSALLYAVPSANVIVPCPNNGFWQFPEFAPTCATDDYDRAGSILHEMTHLYGTTDWAYGPAAAKALTAARASQNADTYEMYAGSVRLGGCSA